MNVVQAQAIGLPEKIIFAILAGATVAGALYTITRRNPVTAVVSLVGTFLALAGIYATLSAHFLTILQVMVYAGAIMVLFIFVVMILNREEISPVSFHGFPRRVVGVGAGIYLLVVVWDTVWRLRGVQVLRGPLGEPPADFGTVATVGMSLFKEFVFPFEAISLLLLVAVVGGLIVSRSHKQEEQAEATARRGKEIRSQVRVETRVGAIGTDTHADESHTAHH